MNLPIIWPLPEHPPDWCTSWLSSVPIPRYRVFILSDNYYLSLPPLFQRACERCTNGLHYSNYYYYYYYYYHYHYHYHYHHHHYHHHHHHHLPPLSHGKKCVFVTPNKGRLAKNLDTKSERHLNLYNRQIMILPRKTKTRENVVGPR